MEAMDAVTEAPYDPPELYLGRERDIFQELLYCFIVPSAIVSAIVLLLIFVMCCRRTGMQKRLKSTSASDLENYESIKQASILLRHLDFERDIPLSPQCLVSTTLREDLTPTSSRRYGAKSAPGTLQRTGDECHAKTPPSYATTDRTRFYNKTVGKQLSGVTPPNVCSDDIIVE